MNIETGPEEFKSLGPVVYVKLLTKIDAFNVILNEVKDLSPQRKHCDRHTGDSSSFHSSE